jgi:hypothetical protein
MSVGAYHHEAFVKWMDDGVREWMVKISPFRYGQHGFPVHTDI